MHSVDKGDFMHTEINQIQFTNHSCVILSSIANQPSSYTVRVHADFNGAVMIKIIVYSHLQFSRSFKKAGWSMNKLSFLPKILRYHLLSNKLLFSTCKISAFSYILYWTFLLKEINIQTQNGHDHRASLITKLLKNIHVTPTESDN